MLNNPCRVAEKQKKFIQFVEGRYVPLLPSRKIGISFLKDSHPGTDDEYLGEIKKAEKMELEKIDEEKQAESPEKKEDEIDPPEEFDFHDDNERLLKDSQWATLFNDFDVLTLNSLRLPSQMTSDKIIFKA